MVRCIAEEVRECLGLRGSRQSNGWRYVAGLLAESVRLT
jgi:hypothetical protein